ncbi:hypothetical protein Dsin_016800 [Dipteronia sinensis]|uniref:Uncharacterized protein n=1 Tax=Dipteronia sinensis TaxID=43782 RepID=A0AAE0ADV6_9ROSI|nr:hypothetical protein Dsin_016800 [Dipteronia sinensis]
MGLAFVSQNKMIHSGCVLTPQLSVNSIYDLNLPQKNTKPKNKSKMDRTTSDKLRRPINRSNSSRRLATEAKRTVVSFSPRASNGYADLLAKKGSSREGDLSVSYSALAMKSECIGKSCIVLQFVRGQFDPTSKVTVGASFLSQTIALQDSTTVKFETWDTDGQERYAAPAPLYYRGAAIAVIMYDITNPESFTKAKYWVKELQKHGSPDIVMALVGNLADLQDSREVPAQDGIDYAEKNGMFFIETSAKTADNINQLFEEIAKRLPRPSRLIHDCGC